MSDPSDWSTEWSRRKAAQYSNLFTPDEIREEPRNALLSLLSRTLPGPKPDQLRAELIASMQQSGCLIAKKDEAVILFDVTQSMVLKRLFELVANDEPYDEAAKVLAAAGGLAVSDQHPYLCSQLLSLTVPEQPEYVHDEATLLEHYRVLKLMLATLLTEWQSSIIDGFIFAHELSHFSFHKADKLMLRVQAGARSAFEFALNEVCYERQPNFEEIARDGGTISIGAEALERIRQDLIVRRAHYEANRQLLTEEITCDSYALTLLMSSHSSAWLPDVDDPNAKLDGFSRFAQTFFLVSALSDLHQAMIKRVFLSAASGIDSDKPAHIADMHFRKIALLYSIAENAMACVPKADWSPEIFSQMLYQVKQVIGLQKNAIDALVVIPITRVLKGALKDIERRSASQQPPGVQQQPWHGRLDLLFGNHLPEATFGPSALATILGTT